MRALRLRAAASGGRNRGIKSCASLSGDQSPANSRMMEMTDGNSQGIGRVVGFGNLAEREKHSYQLLHLLLLSVSISGDRLLHESR
jgi:hypothetical protein